MDNWRCEAAGRRAARTCGTRLDVMSRPRAALGQPDRPAGCGGVLKVRTLLLGPPVERDRGTASPPAPPRRPSSKCPTPLTATCP
ncbi:hypothetical protein J6590_009690 [Homalodisca vitripennis]|nr:hypothetical protein J6590_009690 [Homalodisca vitripennis]